jgi:hypothetical protein
LSNADALPTNGQKLHSTHDRREHLKPHYRSLMSELLKEPKTLEQLQKTKRGNTIAIIHFNTYLQEMIDLGYVFRDGDKFCLSRVGESLLNKKQIRINKVWGHEKYDCAELKMNSMRPGAYDFLKCPSLMGETRFYRKDV